MMTLQPLVRLHRPHPTQQNVLNNRARFNVLKCGRRWGKSVIAVDEVIKALLKGLRVAYFGPTYKDNSEIWMDLKHRLHDVIVEKSETERRLTILTGGVFDMWSMDNPDSGRGRAYHLVIIDECEKTMYFKEAWERTIRATLTDYCGSAWLISTPKFGKTYFKQIYKNPEKYNDWASFKYTSYDNPYLNANEIDGIKEQIDSMTFRCEYLADDVDLTIKAFAWAFDSKKHMQPCYYDPSDYLQLSFDFNVDPITCLAAQSPEFMKMRIFKEFRLENSDIYELCDRIKTTYPSAIYLITGDATGIGRSALTAGNLNYFKVIKSQLGVTDNQMKQKTYNPSPKDARTLANTMLERGDVLIDPSCKYLEEDFIFCEVDDRGKIDKTKDKHRSHLLDCYIYNIHTFHPKILDYDLAA